MTDTSQIIQEMARLTILSGRVSDVQLKNIKTFPLIFFDNVSEVKIDYDLSHKADVTEDDANNKLVINKPTTNHYVAYYLELDEASNEDLDKRFKALEESVRTLFWKDVSVEVYFNNKIKYKSLKYG